MQKETVKVKKVHFKIPLWLVLRWGLPIFAASLVWHLLISTRLPWLPTITCPAVFMAADCPFPWWHTIHPVLLTSPPVSHLCSVCTCVCSYLGVGVFSRNMIFPSALWLDRLTGAFVRGLHKLMHLKDQRHRLVFDSMGFEQKHCGQQRNRWFQNQQCTL